MFRIGGHVDWGMVRNYHWIHHFLKISLCDFMLKHELHVPKFIVRKNTNITNLTTNRGECERYIILLFHSENDNSTSWVIMKPTISCSFIMLCEMERNVRFQTWYITRSYIITISSKHFFPPTLISKSIERLFSAPPVWFSSRLINWFDLLHLYMTSVIC